MNALRKFWTSKSTRQRIVLVSTAILVVLLAAHPELRLLVPLVDALGLDLVLLLVGTQLADHAKPAAALLYAACIFLLGIAGPYLDGYLRQRWPEWRRVG